MSRRILRKIIIPKSFHSQNLYTLDSFTMFKNQEVFNLIKTNPQKISFTIPQYDLIARLHDNHLQVQYNQGSYVIKVEKKATNFGGYYFFFHCPKCDIRAKKIYCIEGQYLCRKCGNLSYYSQKLNSYDRLLYMQNKIEDSLKNQGGSLESKPPWIKQRTYQKLKLKHQEYKRIYYDKAEAAFRAKYPAVSKS